MAGCPPSLVIAGDLLSERGPAGVAHRGEDRRAAPADRREGVGSAGGDADRRGWFLVRLGDHRDIVEAVISAVIRKARLGPSPFDDVEDFAKALAALGVRYTVSLIG